MADDLGWEAVMLITVGRWSTHTPSMAHHVGVGQAAQHVDNATVLEEQNAQRSDIRSLHTEVHASKEELKAEIGDARAEARADHMDLKATEMGKLKGHEQRIDALEDDAGIPHPDKN